jgi:hypothetical protein
MYLDGFFFSNTQEHCVSLYWQGRSLNYKSLALGPGMRTVATWLIIQLWKTGGQLTTLVMLALLGFLLPLWPTTRPRLWWRSGALAPWPWRPWSSVHSVPSKSARRREQRGNQRPSCCSHASVLWVAATKQWLSAPHEVVAGPAHRRCGTRPPRWRVSAPNF